eukprot:296923-Amphidinium_carterae.6
METMFTVITVYGKNKPLHLFVWKQSIAYIRRAAMANGVYSASIYYIRAEDIIIEFVPQHNGQEAVNFNLKGLHGAANRRLEH